jgi:phage FluMu protein Com
MARGKCPSCKQLVSELIIDAHISGFVHPGKQFACVNFLCPQCKTVVGTQMDPVTMKTEVVNMLVQKLNPA